MKIRFFSTFQPQAGWLSWLKYG